MGLLTALLLRVPFWVEFARIEVENTWLKLSRIRCVAGIGSRLLRRCINLLRVLKRQLPLRRGGNLTQIRSQLDKLRSKGSDGLHHLTAQGS